DARELDVTLQFGRLQLQRTGFVACNLQVSRCFRMVTVQGKGALVLQNRAAKITAAKISVSTIVRQICVPLTCATRPLVPVDRLLKMTLREFLVRFCKISLCKR